MDKYEGFIEFIGSKSTISKREFKRYREIRQSPFRSAHERFVLDIIQNRAIMTRTIKELEIFKASNPGEFEAMSIAERSELLKQLGKQACESVLEYLRSHI